MFTCKLSEVFWKMVEILMNKLGSNLHLRRDNLPIRAEAYANAIKNSGDPLHNCAGFIECIKIRMQRPGGSYSNQRSCYSGHKHVHCLICQTLSTPDEHTFHYTDQQKVGNMILLSSTKVDGMKCRKEVCQQLQRYEESIY